MSAPKISQKPTRKSVGGIAFELEFEEEGKNLTDPPQPEALNKEASAEEIAARLAEAEARRVANLREAAEKSAEHLRRCAERAAEKKRRELEDREKEAQEMALDTEIKELRRLQALEQKKNIARKVVEKSSQAKAAQDQEEQLRRVALEKKLEQDLECKENRRKSLLEKVKIKASEDLQKVEQARERVRCKSGEAIKTA